MPFPPSLFVPAQQFKVPVKCKALVISKSTAFTEKDSYVFIATLFPLLKKGEGLGEKKVWNHLTIEFQNVIPLILCRDLFPGLVLCGLLKGHSQLFKKPYCA